MTPAPDDDALPVVRAADLDDGDALPRWLVDTLWGRAAVGVLGGAPKSCKSWLALDLAVSVATGTACLGAFDLDDAGPVLLYMAEDAAPVVKARLSGICRARSLELASVPIHVITVPVLRLDRGRDQARLRDAVRRYAPRLLVLDPFVRLHRIDENDAGEVSALLGYLRTLQRQYDVAVLVVHHARKNGGAGAQAGQSLRGSRTSQSRCRRWIASRRQLPRRDSGSRSRAGSPILFTRPVPAREPRRPSPTRARDDRPRRARAGTALTADGSPQKIPLAAVAEVTAHLQRTKSEVAGRSTSRTQPTLAFGLFYSGQRHLQLGLVTALGLGLGLEPVQGRDAAGVGRASKGATSITGLFDFRYIW